MESRERRDRAWSLGIGATLVGVVAVVLGPALVGRGVLLDVELLRNMWPYRGHGTVDDAIVCRGDTVDFYMPGVANIRAALFNGNLLTWSPYEVGGAPLASLPNHGALSPLSWPYFTMPLWLAPAFVKLSELVVVVVGMVLLLGRFGVRRSAGMLAGLVFFTSGFMVMWSNWPQTKVAAFIPLLFWALERVVANRRPVDTALVAAAVAAMLLGGFPAVTMYALTFGGVFVLVRGVREARDHGRGALLAGWAGAAGGVVLGVGISAIQLLPFASAVQDIGYEDREAGGPLPLGYAFTSIAPDALGTCRAGESFGPLNPVEGITFLGAGALVLVLFAVVAGRGRSGGPRRPALMGALLLVAVVLVWLGGPLLDLLQLVPGYDHNPITRMSSLLGFLTAALAGFGFDRLLRRAEDDVSGRPPTPGPARVAAGVAALVVVGSVLVPGFVEARRWAEERDRLEPFTTRAGVALALVAVALLGMALTSLLRGRLRVIGPILVAAVVVGQSVAFAQTMLPLSEREDFYPTTDAHQFLTGHLGQDRYASSESWGNTSIADYYRLRTPLGHEFTDPDWMAALRAIDPGVDRSRTYTQFTSGLATAGIGHSPLLDQLAVRFWATGPSDVVGLVEPPSNPGRGSTRVGNDRRAECTFEARPLRGVQLELARGFTARGGQLPVLHTRITTPDGVVEGEQTLTGRLPKGAALRIGVAGEHLRAPGTARAEFWVTGTRGQLALTGPEDALRCSPVVPPVTDDGLTLVHTDRGSLIYERTTALPRIRWAGRTQVVPDADQQLELLETGIPADTVLLTDGTPQAARSEATIDIVEDAPETIRITVDADGPGHVVLADSIAREGWTATIDGHGIPILDANRALAAVPVPRGQHTLVLRYDAPGLRTGTYVTAGSLLITLTLCAAHLLTRRRHRVPEPDGPEPDGPEPDGPESGPMVSEG